MDFVFGSDLSVDIKVVYARANYGQGMAGSASAELRVSGRASPAQSAVEGPVSRGGRREEGTRAYERRRLTGARSDYMLCLRVIHRQTFTVM